MTRGERGDLDIPVGKDERLVTSSAQMVPVLDRPSGLVQERHEAHRMGVGTDAIIDSRRIGHVAAVVGRVEILTVPAAGKANADLETAVTGAVREALEGIESLFAVLEEADELDSLVLEGVGPGASAGIAREHAETLGERLDGLLRFDVGVIDALPAG